MGLNNIVYYKIGMERYKNGKDKNSGLYEYNLILNELEKIDSQVKKGTLIVLSGALDNAEKRKVEEMINDCHSNGTKAIYIVTDSCAMSKTFMNLFDVVLHQAWEQKMKGVKVQQAYSYVPELFFTGEVGSEKYKHDLLLFCGNDTGRQDKIKDYIRDEHGCKPNTFSLVKYSNGVDERIEHEEYLKLLKRFKYNLMICRQDYRGIGWITARLIESIDNWCLPVFDYEFDKNNAYRIPELTVDPNHRGGFTKVYLNFKNKPEEVENILVEMRSKVKERKEKFLETVLKCLEG